jgi:hypothetical membrane protein
MTTAVSPPRQRPAPSRTKSLARFALAGVAVYVAIDVLLAFLRPGYSLIYNAESDYGRGPWFWVMDLNFLLRCALSLAIASALSQVLRPDGRTRGGLALLVTWAICSGLLAFFADDPEGTPQHGSGVVHLVLAFIAFTAIAYLLLGAALKHHHAPDGLYERVFLGLELLWIAVAATALFRRAPAGQSE